ncbi:VanW family protein [Nocardioides sp. Root151]|uniref:VanW family protein n=1 Tax=Nocardioides sp. Root151 TaxID=1736475 RepID=UPI000A4B8488|nr:VanW family protein [Nocardioides sp. Root151]
MSTLTRVTLADAATMGLDIPAQVVAPPRLTQRLPALYPWAVRAHRVRRRIQWMRSDTAWATERRTTSLPVRVKKHASLLMRELSEDEMVLQRNKVVNLRLASARVDGIVIRPGESFSFNKAVGNCTRSKGYVEGMRLSNGAAVPGVGGGICQLANLLHWMFLHSPLTVVERSEHSFDPFPDKGRVLPWGVGCSIVYNYVDLVVRNDTAHTFQLKAFVDERHLRGELLVDELPETSYKVEARNEAFLRHDGEIFRKNEIWRTVISRRSGNAIGEELLKKNCALVKYEPADGRIIDVVD